ncbi:3-deoxy-D-manno-octulosonic-acid transferase [Desulfatibacillum alkenivorans DSM 16219]|jgi:3-deoxy-D-manno-octulosonic-acid transferase|uniref:3-deoxy-D-manno-octulosonic acid transferase n=1 Tax=Desulfatibacillum alkenivorans DSM 16219 TaxID=1121393 RepID=A0A1M6VG94_9BACT|nr:3-deoxy-D-manno-octulosonic acid transferase [Desulfatibacillum alkenivorans]SHK80512.1 3-deoxy-D-manno-octulosonic-acid transferase [Desulfatibacillum alkenivorans DSM 16219]
MVKAVYNLALCLGAILFLPIGLILAALKEKRRTTMGPRLGFQAYPQCSKPIWVHGLSVGEINAAVPMVLALAQAWPHKDIIVSASTKTGYDNARAKLQDHVAGVVYYPYDLPWCVSKALDQVDPCMFILVESDLWPNFIFQCKQRGVPLILANGRLSDSSYKGYRNLGFLMKPVFQCFNKVGAQSKEEGERFLKVGVRSESMVVTGNLKFDRPYAPDLKPLEALPDFSGPVFVAGSTHPGEEEILAGLLKARNKEHNLAIIIAPRDPKRAGDVRDIFSRNGLDAALYSQKPEQADAVVVDQMGLLAALYSRGDICFVGGSLLPFGGHNPLEPALFGKPVLFGPDMGDFPDITARLLNQGGAIQVKDSQELAQTVHALLDDPARGVKIGANALEVIRRNRGALQRNLDLVQEFIENHE